MTREMLTKEAADKFSGLAERLQSRGHPPEAVAHFIMQLVFCFFAEDVKLLPEGFFRKALKQLNIGNRHEHAKAMLDDMFSAMATKGGRVGNEFIAYFNGGLFDGQAALPLDDGDLGLLVAVGSMRWAEIDPSIFGTLFERFLDPAKRAQIGAHYTDAKKILQIVDPVVMRPLEAEWAEVKERIEKLASLAQEKGPRAKEWAKAEEERGRFLERLASLRILDPACGSGNFLYMALQRVKDLEFRVNNECEKLGLSAGPPRWPGNPPRHRDQPARRRDRPHHDLDRRHRMGLAPRALHAARAGFTQARSDRMPGRSAIAAPGRKFW
jgi:hypothetical protein